MEQIRVEDAVGMVLCHDMTEIIPGERKGCAFRKGHIIQQQDIEKLLDIGKRYIYVWDLKKGYLHENDAALRMATAAVGKGVALSPVKEGKIELRAVETGIVKIDLDTLYAVNELEEVCFATIRHNKLVQKGTLLAGTRVIPLVVKESLIQQFEQICKKNPPMIQIVPLKPAKIGIVTTGSEIQSGRISDQFGEVLRQKATETGSEIIGQVFPGDDQQAITTEILNFIEQGADLVEVTGGMSVDPDDVTPSAIRACKGEIITYGAPVLPGAMFMLSYIKGIPVVGLPGCVMYAKRTIFDLVVPRLLAGERLRKQDFIKLAHGGQCSNCTTCIYPNCGFGE